MDLYAQYSGYHFRASITGVAIDALFTYETVTLATHSSIRDIRDSGNGCVYLPISLERIYTET